MSFIKDDNKDFYFKAGLKLKNIYSKKDLNYKSSRFLMFPQVGLGLKTSKNTRSEIFYHPVILTGGKAYKDHSVYFRFLFHL